jgi:transcriptional regulator with XRE-family HTH domain
MTEDWHYIVAMSENLGEAVRQALERAPCSDRALAVLAGVPPSTVSRVKTGARRGATRDVAKQLADALSRWAAECAEAETILRRALEQEKKR